jgi:hypothetical protein
MSVARDEPEGEDMTMRPLTSNPYRRVDYSRTKADRTTLWLLLLVVAGLVIALTFSDASGAAMFSGA